MTEDTRTHKINLIITTNKEWKSEDVVKTVQELLEMENDGVENPSFIDIEAMNDPTNSDMGLQDSIESSLGVMGIYADSLEYKLSTNNALEMFKDGINMIKHGITDLKACVRCAQFLSAKLHPDIKIAKVGLEELKHAPEEVIHAIAHTLGMDHGACEGMSKDDMIAWIENNVRGEPRTIN